MPDDPLDFPEASGRMRSLKNRDSEFGQGCIYNLGLFIAHQYNAYILEEQYSKLTVHISWPEMWFNGAGDHMFDLVIPKNYPIELQERLSYLQTQCLHWRMSLGEAGATKDNVWWALGEAKELLRLIDEFHGVRTVKGMWE